MAGRTRKLILGNMLSLFEDALVRVTESSLPRIDFSPALIVDIRKGLFEAFVLSLRNDGTLYRIARPIRIEEAEGISVARDSTPLCAYRRQRSAAWVACSRSRLEEIRSSTEIQVAEHILAYGMELEESEQQRTLERLLFSFLSLLAESDSAQAYNQVVFIIDDEQHRPLLQAVLPKVGARLDNGSKPRWQSAMIVMVDATTDLSAYAFLTTPSTLIETGSSYLLLPDQNSAREFIYDGSELRPGKLNNRIKYDKYKHVIVVGMTPQPRALPGFEFVNDMSAFQKMCLNGYITWSLQIDEARLSELRQRHERLKEELQKAREQTYYLQQLADRLQVVINRLNGE